MYQRVLALRSSSALIAVVAFSCATALGQTPAKGAPDFAARYGTKLVRTEPVEPLEWTSEDADVWRLKSFSFNPSGDLTISGGASTVVFGAHEKNVVWAAVLPDDAATITAKSAGDGEHAVSIWMRFAPASVYKLFPAANVIGPGRPQSMVWARRLASHKMNCGWQADNFPVIPTSGSIVFDCDTKEGPRRYYAYDGDKRIVEYISAFQGRTLPALVPLEPKDAVQAFDAAWKEFDTTYAKFGLRPGVDWDALKTRYRPWAEGAHTTFEAGATIALLVEHLRDLHVWVKAGDEWCPQYSRFRPQNAVFPACKAMIGTVGESQHELAWGKTADGIGYICTFGLSDKEGPTTFDRALEDLASTWALIVDLRLNGGGGEDLGAAMAGRIVDKKRTYSSSQYRTGTTNRTAIGAPIARNVEPRGPWRYGAPVIALIGQKTMSSAESFACMLAQCPNVTTMGDHTAGASANPKRLELPGNIVVNVPRWNDLDPNGKPLEDVGLAPQVAVPAKPSDFSATNDPVLAKALEQLRKTAKAKRTPAHGK